MGSLLFSAILPILLNLWDNNSRLLNRHLTEPKHEFWILFKIDGWTKALLCVLFMVYLAFWTHTKPHGNYLKDKHSHIYTHTYILYITFFCCSSDQKSHHSSDPFPPGWHRQFWTEPLKLPCIPTFPEPPGQLLQAICRGALVQSETKREIPTGIH